MTIPILLTEPQTVEYIHVDESNKVNLLLPIVGGDTFGLDNTCKTALEMQVFFHGKVEVSKYVSGKKIVTENARPSALDVLKSYQDTLEHDIQILENFPQVKREKEERLEQIKGYIAILEIVKHKYITRSEPHPNFPLEIHHFLNEQTNCLSVQLSPKIPDHFLRTQRPVFSLKRPVLETEYVNGFMLPKDTKLVPGLGLSLRTKLKETLIQLKRSNNAKQLLLDEIVKHYEGKSPPTLSALQDYMTQQIEEKFRLKVDFKKSRYNDAIIDEGFFSTMGDDYDLLNIEEAVHTIFLSALEDAFWDAIPQSPFYNFKLDSNMADINAATLDQIIQFFLASASIYLKEKGILKNEFSSEFDKRADSIAERIDAAMRINKPVEEVLFFIINEIQQSLGAQRLNDEDKKTINARFFEQYSVLKDSPHFDEFIFFLPKVKGDFFSHKNRISLPFLDLISTSIGRSSSLTVLERQRINNLVISHHLQDNVAALKNRPQRQLSHNNFSETSTLPNILKLVDKKNNLDYLVYFCNQLQSKTALAEQLSFKELNAFYNHPRFEQIERKITELSAQYNNPIYKEALEYGKNHLFQMRERLLYSTEKNKPLVINHTINETANWAQAAVQLKKCITSYKNRLTYFFKDSAKKSRIERLEKTLQACEMIENEDNINRKQQVLLNCLNTFNDIINEIALSQPDKKSTLGGEIKAIRQQFISLFKLQSAAIVINPNDPEQALLDFERSVLPAVDAYKCLHSLNSTWWTKEGLETIKQIPSSYYKKENIDFFNATSPSDWTEFHLKAIQIDSVSLSLDNFNELPSRGRFIKNLESYYGDSEIPKPLLNLSNKWWTEEGLEVIKQLPKRSYTEETVKFLGKTSPCSWNVFQLKAIKVDSIILNEQTDLGRLTVRGEFISNLEAHYGSLEQCKSLLNLKEAWWRPEHFDKIKKLNLNDLNENTIRQLNSQGPKAPIITSEQYNSSQNKSKHLDEKGNTTNSNSSPMASVQPSIVVELGRAKADYQKHAKSKLFDFRGKTADKNRLIDDVLTRSVALLKHGGGDFKGKLDAVRSDIIMLNNHLSKEKWSWFALTYTTTKSNEILSKVIKELDEQIHKFSNDPIGNERSPHGFSSQ